MYRLLSIIAILFFVNQALAQVTTREKAVYRLFEKPEKITWIKHYKGRLDGFNDVAVTLAYDGRKCKGQMVYLRSNAKFTLFGEISENEITLQEVDKKNAISGYIYASISEDALEGEWNNFDNTIGSTLRLKQVADEIKFPGHCGDNKWVNHYKGAIQREGMELILQKMSSTEVLGIAYWTHKKESYNVVGEQDRTGKLKLALLDNNKKEIAQIEGVIKNQQLSSVIYKDNETTAFTSFHLEESLPVGCIEYADYVASYDITYPKTKNAMFNFWIDNLAMDWVNDCKQFVQNDRRLKEPITPALRSTVRAFGWCDVQLMSDRLISGTMNYSTTWSDAKDARAFNFDLYTGRELALNDVFENDFNHNRMLKSIINKKINKHRLYKDSEFRTWLAEEDFTFFTIRKDGINFSTKFNMIYGRQNITIPYNKLKPYLKKYTAVWDLATK